MAHMVQNIIIRKVGPESFHLLKVLRFPYNPLTISLTLVQFDLTLFVCSVQSVSVATDSNRR